MVHIRGDKEAFGAPGAEPRWIRGDKAAVGTAYSADSRLWFTVWRGVVSEIFGHTIDQAQVRDCQLLLWTEGGLFHEEQRDLEPEIHDLDNEALGYHVISRSPDAGYVLHKMVITHPHLPCLLQRLWIEGEDKNLSKLQAAVLCTPILAGEGKDDAAVYRVGDRDVLTAHDSDVWIALSASCPFTKASCGFVAASDGWSDLAENERLTWTFDRASGGNVALTGQLPMSELRQGVTVALSLGRGRQEAHSGILQALAVPFSHHRDSFIQQWARAQRDQLPLHDVTGDGGRLYRRSCNVLLAHEDKTHPGGMIASLSEPWGQLRGSGSSGYHVVWCRDMAHCAIGLFASGDHDTPLRCLSYLIAAQAEDGGFPQNFWIDGRANAGGVQLDEVAMPILLARRLHRAGALGELEPVGMVRLAAAYLIRHGPATQQERWEEASGFSPSTLATSIAALISAAAFLREDGAEADAIFIEEYADFLESHLEGWTVTERGRLHPEISRHYLRILPAAVDDPYPKENPDEARLGLANQPPEAQGEYEARDIVDAGFLHLVRYGIRPADDPLICDSLRVIDRVLRVDLPQGPSWYRYNHDGYGQRADGGPYDEWGQGRPWPLLTAERALYELAAGGDPRALLRSLEQFAGKERLLPEQVWEAEAIPGADLYPGGPTGSVRPLAWAHAMYIILVRSLHDGELFERIPEVVDRYCEKDGQRATPMEIWKPCRRPQTVGIGERLRFQAPEPFNLSWSNNSQEMESEVKAISTGLGIWFVDIGPFDDPGTQIRAHLFWAQREEWEPEQALRVR